MGEVLQGSYLFRTNKRNYLLADYDLPLNCLPFEEENLQFVSRLKSGVRSLVPSPEHNYELGSGYGKYSASYTHLNVGEARRIVQLEIDNIQRAKKDAEERAGGIPALESEMATLDRLAGSLSV